jgi:hypothetical protein
MSFSKYGNKQSGDFPSKLEKAVYELLVLREKAGEISDIRRQVSLVLQDGPQNVKITWRIDFAYTDKKNQTTTYCEAKGVETETYRLKLKLFRKNPLGRLEIWKGSYKKLYLDEVIE